MAEEYLAAAARRLRDRGLVVETVVSQGDPAKALLHEAQTRDVDLILLGTHGRSGLGRWIYGSVAEAVLGHSSVPVLLARAWTEASSR